MPIQFAPTARSAFLKNRLRFVLTLQNQDVQPLEPVKGIRVVVRLLGADGKPGEELVKGRTDADGRIGFFIEDLPPKDAAQQLPALPKVQFTVLDIDGDAIGKAVDLQLERGKELPAQKVSITAHLEKLDAPLKAWETATKAKLTPKLKMALADNKIASLAKLREAGSFEKGAGLNAAEKRALENIRKHARLQLISRNHLVNEILVKAGISNVTDIADLTQNSFVQKLKGQLEPKAAITLHYVANQAATAGQNIAFAERVDAARNAGDQARKVAGEAQPCACDCLSAVSPAAYIADLLDYTVRHVRLNDKELSMERLEAEFFQPFGSLPADCSASEVQVRQVRLCIEVLRRKATKDGKDISEIIGAHAQRSYHALLAELGVSHTDLRLARAASEERRQLLADRMGVPANQLLQFLLNEEDQTEQKLEGIFGLATTDPADPGTVGPSLVERAKLARLRESWLIAETATNPVRIEPDFLSASLFAGTGSKAEELLVKRREQQNQLFKAIVDKVITAKALGDVLTTKQDTKIHGMHGLHLGAAGELDGFNLQRQNGQPYSRKKNGTIIPLDLPTLGIRKAELDQLLIVRQLDVEGTSTEPDWADAHHILLAIEKRRKLVPIWQQEERAEKIVLSPDVFALPGDAFALLTKLEDQSAPFLRWRLDLTTMRDWVVTLKDRIAQRDTALASIEAAHNAADEAHLVALRDALVDKVIDKNAAGINATDSSAERLEKKKRFVTNHLLISAHESACRRTTRTAQAIECLQVLIWGLHNNLVELPGFILDHDGTATDFENLWKSLGSYKTWRSLMWVYLYPENLARPSFKNQNGSSSVFKEYTFLMNNWILVSEEANDGLSGDDFTRLHDEYGASDRILNMLLILMNSYRYRLSDYMSAKWLDEVWKLISFVGQQGVYNLRYHSLRRAEFDRTEIVDAFYYIPLDIGFRLKDLGRSAESITWLRRAAELPTGQPVSIEARDALADLRTTGGALLRDDEWLTSPLPHEAAERTLGGYERRVVLGAISTYLDMAEADFAIDTAESLARARESYLAAIDLLSSPVLGTPDAPCSALTIEIGDPKIREVVEDILGAALPPGAAIDFNRDEIVVRDKEIEKVIKDFKKGDDIFEFSQKVRAVYTENMVARPQQKIAEIMAKALKAQKAMTEEALDRAEVYSGVQAMSVAASGLFELPRISPPSRSFCIPPNPVLQMLRLRAESGFFKLTHCMNVAGLKRETAPYAAPTDVTSGVAVNLAEPKPVINGNEYFNPPGAVLYRFKALIDRAKQLTATAQQVENTYLSFLDRKDAEQYNLVKARQDLGLANATVILQDLRVLEASNGKLLASSQLQRAEEGSEYYKNLVENGLLESEEFALNLQRVQMFLQFGIAAARGAVFLAAGAGLDMSAFGLSAGSFSLGSATLAAALDQQVQQGIVGGVSSWAAIVSTQASYERRFQEWDFQKRIADFDVEIATIQQTIAEDRVQITRQEQRISQLNRDHADDVIEFLDSKFTGGELYSWMSGVVGEAYRYFLQQAALMAKLAQRQLAFERQEPELGIILDDYLAYTPQGSLPGSSGPNDRKGMTGSVRLLEDITRLDQRAFLSDRRRIPLPKHISLSSHDPIAFMRFRETGILPIATTQDMFDRDFPGDYLRLVKRIRVSVIALIPPLDGIKATLASSGISRVVRGGDRYTETPIATQPETVAITAPVSGPGIIELQQEQADMLLPFEGLGVASNWVFSMPKAANAFDFNTIADVVFSMEYSGIYSDEYRQQVVQRLNADRSFQGERAYSLRQQFADEWYSLHHPELVDDPNKLRPVLELRRSDYPPNLADRSLKLSHLTIYVARKDGITDEVEVSELSWDGQFVQGAGLLTTRNGLLSTRDAPGSAWLALAGRSPVGKLAFKLSGRVDGKSIDEALREGLITDILVAVAIRGDLPEWPL